MCSLMSCCSQFNEMLLICACFSGRASILNGLYVPAFQAGLPYWMAHMCLFGKAFKCCRVELQGRQRGVGLFVA